MHRTAQLPDGCGLGNLCAVVGGQFRDDVEAGVPVPAHLVGFPGGCLWQPAPMAFCSDRTAVAALENAAELRTLKRFCHPTRRGAPRSSRYARSEVETGPEGRHTLATRSKRQFAPDVSNSEDFVLFLPRVYQ